jgi:hypothetical protein
MPTTTRSPIRQSGRTARTLSAGVCAIAVVAVSSLAPDAQTAAPAQAKVAKAAPGCVDIGTPRPALVFTYRLTVSTGTTSQFTHQWESVTPTESRVRVHGTRGIEIVANRHRIVNDASVIERTTKANANGAVTETTTFQPGIVGDPAFRACVGRSWQIPSVTASFRSGTQNHSSPTPAGLLSISAIREKVTVPAGTFDTVRYTRTSQSRDEYWKSIEHGVVVRHIGVLPTGRTIEELIAIK